MGKVIDVRQRVGRLSLSAQDRAAIEAKIDELITILDQIDGDPDLEDDDPAGDPLDAGEAPEATSLMPTSPVYGIDQTKGPINEHEAHRLWERGRSLVHRQQRAAKLMIASDGQERLFMRHPANGCLLAKED